MDSSVYDRYAKVFYELVVKDGTLLLFIENFVTALSNESDIVEFIKRCPKQEKIVEYLEKTILTKAPNNFKEIIDFLVYRSRLNSLVGILNELVSLSYKEGGYQKLLVESSFDLEKQDLEKIKNYFQKLVKFKGKKIKISQRINDKIIGGVKIYDYDYTYDFSVKTLLTNFKKNILTA